MRSRALPGTEGRRFWTRLTLARGGCPPRRFSLQPLLERQSWPDLGYPPLAAISLGREALESIALDKILMPSSSTRDLSHAAQVGSYRDPRTHVHP